MFSRILTQRESSTFIFLNYHEKLNIIVPDYICHLLYYCNGVVPAQKDSFIHDRCMINERKREHTKKKWAPPPAARSGGIGKISKNILYASSKVIVVKLTVRFM